MIKRSEGDGQARRTPSPQMLRTDFVSDDLLLMSEFVDRERTLRLRDLLDSLALEGEPFDVKDLVGMAQTTSEVPIALTERERDALRLLATGASNYEIAGTMMVTVNTVKTHLNSVYSKLNVHSRMEAIVRAWELNLL